MSDSRRCPSHKRTWTLRSSKIWRDSSLKSFQCRGGTSYSIDIRDVRRNEMPDYALLQEVDWKIAWQTDVIISSLAVRHIFPYAASKREVLTLLLLNLRMIFRVCSTLHSLSVSASVCLSTPSTGWYSTTVVWKTYRNNTVPYQDMQRTLYYTYICLIDKQPSKSEHLPTQVTFHHLADVDCSLHAMRCDGLLIMKYPPTTTGSYWNYLYLP
jgi:hypothetical protein